jgi:hypothetical protein
MDPRRVWLSENFRLSDFLGNHSVYARGFRNRYEVAPSNIQLDNAEALCGAALEPLLQQAGPVSLAYGYISPEFSRQTVKYQDPDKPSHHRWDLGAAADVVSHKWVQGMAHTPDLMQLFADENTRTSPALLAHAIDAAGTPYSRLISYSESPYLCIAVAARELAKDDPRKAFYENRYMGVPKVKPAYLQLATVAARERVREELQETGLQHPWRGGGFPSYHGGGIRQYQHMRVSKYTTVLDWLFNLKSISEGAKNIPALTSEAVLDAFATAGLVYDHLLESLEMLRIPVEEGYLCRSHPDYEVDRDWRQPVIRFSLATTQAMSPIEFYERAREALPREIEVTSTQYGASFRAPVDDVLHGLLG